MQKRLWRLLRVIASRRTALVAMVLMAAVLGLASLQPDAEKIVVSPYFLILPSYLFLAIALSVAERVETYVRTHRRGRERTFERFRVERQWTSLGTTSEVVAHARASLTAAHYRVESLQPDVVFGRRGSLGFAGSLAFHMGLLCVLAGVSMSSRTRMNGEILLTEGFSTPLVHSSFVSLTGAQRLPALPDTALSIRDFVADYSPSGTPVDFAALLSVVQSGALARQAVVRVNDAFAWNGFQLTLHRYGFAPEIVAVDADGRERMAAVMVLQLLPPGREDTIPLGDGEKLRVVLYPDFVLRQNEPASRSLVPRKPVLGFVWLDRDDRTLASGRIERGREATVAGRRVRFAALSYWAGFVVARDQGLWLFVAGSLLGALGLAVRLAFPDQALRLECRASPRGTLVQLTASTRFFPALHQQQIDALVRRLNV